jgi:hypothetical protein
MRNLKDLICSTLNEFFRIQNEFPPFQQGRHTFSLNILEQTFQENRIKLNHKINLEQACQKKSSSQLAIFETVCSQKLQ